MNVGVLDHSQPIGAKPSQFTDRESADFLVHIMAAERISRKVIRRFGPGSPFPQIRPTHARYVPERLTSGEISGVRYIPASSKDSHRRNAIVLRALTRIWFREISAQKPN